MSERMTTMPSTNAFFVITFDKIDATQTRQVQAVIEREAVSWWHQQSLVWVVEGGENPTAWRDKLKVIVLGVRGTMLVLELPKAPEERRFGGVGGTSWWPWLRETMQGLAPLPSAKSPKRVLNLKQPDEKA